MRARLSRLDRLDDLRAVAASLVFACHASLWWLGSEGRPAEPGLFYLGRFGVAIFFVISGLVIYRPFVEARRSGRNPNVWAYTVRRVLRIVPAYWIALALLLILLPQQLPLLGSGSPALFAGFGQIYSSRTFYGGLAVAWSLDVELCFYAAAPIIALGVGALIRRTRSGRIEGLFLLCVGLLSVAVRQLSPDGVIGGTIVGYGGWFAIGMALAVASANQSSLIHRIRLRPGALWALAAAGYLVLARHLSQPNPFPDQGTLLDYCGLGFLAALVVLGAVSDSGKATPIGKWLGDRSYGVYLWHLPILVWLATKGLAGWEYLGAALCLTLLAAHLSFLLVERPLMRRAGTFVRQRAAHEKIPPDVRLAATPTT